MYRILRSRNEVRERRKQAVHRNYEKPELLALGANQVWSWDITKLKGPQKGQLFYLYVIIDIFSRYVVGWTLSRRESGEVAKTLISETCWRQQIDSLQLQIHSDRGAPMKSKNVTDLLEALGVAKTFSRPQVSNDNPYSESQFKTLKHQPIFPERFGSFEDAEVYCQWFFPFYNNEHLHSSLGMLTPHTVHFGLAAEMIANRQKILDAAYAGMPERFVNGPPKVASPPEAAWINPPEPDKVAKILSAARVRWEMNGKLPSATIRSVMLIGHS